MSSKWKLQIIDQTRRPEELLASVEFDDFPSLRLKIVEHRGMTYRVRLPDHASQIEMAGLLDLRSQGFKVEQIVAK